MPTAARSNGGALALVFACATAAAAAAADDTAQSPSAAQPPIQWLERMNRALTTRNYDGTFSHWQGGRVETLRIIHRVQNGVVSERLASLDGSGREFIRTGSSLSCYLPDKRTVVVEQRPREEPLVGFPTVNDQTATFYDIREIGRTRISRRDTHVITVSPKDEYRYGYRLWIDDATAMPLKTQLCDARGRVIEQVVFANLALPARIPDRDFRPEISTAGFAWQRNDAPPPPAGEEVAWNAAQLPRGFRMTVRRAQLMPGSADPVDHLVFSDGFASVSVFVEPHAGAAEAPVTQSAAVGSSSVFSTVVDGHKITAVGEVPPATVQFIATQVKAQGAPPRGLPRR
ncbi:MAG: MucB/RseB C-terminal domain-containing protein [Gammaproteobacteria bacterium]|nr:MucB/RseB C-terminal domain-containing protein [Gammaproteobacteria bacterium]MBV8495676.1 MucB/RseB C-terminal domain-containing protein [Gammaproteobacteria bacterium]